MERLGVRLDLSIEAIGNIFSIVVVAKSCGDAEEKDAKLRRLITLHF